MSALEWQKSSFSSGNADSDCIEVAAGPKGTLYLRESDTPSLVLTATGASLRGALTYIRTGRETGDR